MKKAYLPIGPQCAGKSTFCRKAIEAFPDIAYICRDDILTELFGSPYLDSKYTGEHFVGLERMWEQAAETLRRDNITLILDTWNSSARDRRKITEKLRELGAEQITGWRFVTPEEACLEWYLARECDDIRDRSEHWKNVMLEIRKEEYRDHHQYFHKLTISLDEGFDSVLEIDPTKITPQQFRWLSRTK